MTRTFITTSIFQQAWAEMGLGEEEQQYLENALLLHPNAGAVIQGLQGARKLRISLPNRGKSGGARVIYVDIVAKEQIYLLHAYPKNKQADLTQEEKKNISKIIQAIKGGIRHE